VRAIGEQEVAARWQWVRPHRSRGLGLPVQVQPYPMRHIDPYTDTWVAHRARRVQVRTATKNQLMGRAIA